MFAQKRQQRQGKNPSERERRRSTHRRKKNTKSKEGGDAAERAQNRVIHTYTHAVVYEEDIKEIQNERRKRR
jgi:hypothetical protein